MTNIPLDAIRLDGDTQARAETSDEHVTDLYEAIVAGAEMPPVILFHDGGPDYWIGDGHHRIAAYRKAKHRQVKAEVHQGGLRDAQLFACGANTAHGLKRSNADKRDAVVTLLFDVQDPCRHGHHVCGDRRPTDQCWSQFSDREIARRCAVSQPFVSKLRAELVPASVPDNSYQIEAVRTVTRSGTTYAMNTANIGAARKAEGGKWASRQPANIQALAARERAAQPARSQAPAPATPPSSEERRVAKVLDHFEHVLGVLEGICGSMETVEAPQLEPGRGKEVDAELDRAIADIKAFKARVRPVPSNADMNLDLVADEIAKRLQQHPAVMAEWLELFQPEAQAIVHLTIGELVAAIDARVKR